ncbi:RNA polymerase subunit [Trichodelitschia bisporula]|uniref:DNA-directed RNA polymerases I, II, and III subunit RPABC1 n=1 Tax=Trichodelitschia bisporula TaxID=703511 RepID=A0A6G1IAN9_9PEZI|nr:RNA polymerase subunit [Trichodelitschia bisporula]
MDDTGEAQRECVKLWRVWRTVRQMCKDRGYEVLDSEINITLDEFRSRFADVTGFPERKQLNFSLRPTDAMIAKYTEIPTPSRPNPPEPHIGNMWVEFNGESNLGVKPIRLFAQHIDQNNFFSGILITTVPVTSAALKITTTLAPRTIEIFQEQDLLVNITKHELVPKHVLLSPEEKAKLLERYRLKETQLPRIQRTDPVARYLGLRRGQVVKIIRKSETAGRYASYRWCI